MRVPIIALLMASASTAPAAVTGRVFTAEGKPVPAAVVTAYALETPEERAERLTAGQERRGLISVKSGADGTFRLEVADAVVAVGARADGHAPALTTAGPGEPAELSLPAAAARRGRVAAGGKGAAGAIVVFMANDDDPQSAELLVRTAADGTFEAPDPDLWATSLVVLHPDAALLAASPAPRWPASLAFTLEGGARVEGQVTEQGTGRPVPGATVWLDGWPRARSGPDGTFVIAHGNARWDRIAARTAQLAGTAKRTPGRVAVAVRPLRRLTGVVRDAATRQPLPGASVAVMNDEDRGAIANAITDARGQYVISALSAGRYWPYAGRRGFTTSTVEGMTEPLDLRKTAALSHDFELKALRRMAGRVVDEQGRPVDGASVAVGFDGMGLLYGDLGTIMGSAMGSVRSGPDGSFSLPLGAGVAEAAGKANVPLLAVALKEGFAAGRTKVPPAASAPAVITLPRGIPLRGRVLDAGGAPVADVSVLVAEPGPMFSLAALAGTELAPWARTDAAGAFAIAVQPVRHHLLFKKKGLAPKLVDSADPRGGEELSVVLEPAAALSGRLVRADGRGVAEAALTLMAHSAPPVAVASAVTEADGAFAFADLAPGAYEMAIADAKGLSATRPVTAPARDLRVEILPTATVRGRVFDAATRAPLRRYWLSFARGEREAQGTDYAAARSEEIDSTDGSFAMEDVPVGEWTLSVYAEGYRRKQVEGVAVSTEAGAPDLEVVMEPGAVLRGRITGPDGEPLPDSWVAVTRGAGDDAGAASDESGDYEVKGISAGEATVAVTHKGYRSVRRTVDATKTPRLDIALTRGVVVTGVVVDGEAGVPKARVMASSGALDADSQDTITDASGRFTLQGLAPGRYAITAWLEDKGKAELKDVDIETVGPLRLVLSRAAQAVLVGTVVGLREGDGPPAMVAVRVVGVDGTSAFALADSSGAFRVEEAPAGRVSVTATAMSSAGTRTTQASELTLAAGSETSIVLEFKDDLAVTGRVLRAGAPVAAAMVSFTASGRGASATTDHEGRYEVKVAAGTYDVSVNGQGTSFHTEHAVAESGVFDIDVTGGGVRGRTVEAGAGTPVAKADVSLWLLEGTANTPASTLVTTEQGTFDAPSLREGRYRVIASKKGYGQQVREVEVARGGTAEVLVELSPAEGVTVTVTDARDGRPLEAIVVVRDAARRIVANRHAGADAEGAVTIPLADGSYMLSTSATGYGTATVAITSPARGLRVGLTPGGSLVIESPRALTGRIRLVQPNGEEYVRCWCNGIADIKLDGRRTLVENVASGPYTLELVDAPGESFSRSIAIQEGQTTTVTID